jgi:xylulokinase
MAHQIVLGIDSSTQSTKVVAVDLESGAEIAESRTPHTGADVQDPRDWWVALGTSIAALDLTACEVAGLAVGGQQHGLVTLDRAGEPVRPAPLWNNLDSAVDAERLNGLADFATEVGSRLVASFTITKLAHLARTAPADLARTVAVALPHDYLNFRLTGAVATDRGEASGSGWWSPVDGEIRRDLLALAIGDTEAQRIELPAVRGPEEIAGHLTNAAADALGLRPGIPVGPGSGDNSMAAVGIGATETEIVVGLGTSGVAYAVSDRPSADRSGEVAGFADATGRYLPLACMINCTRVLDTMAAAFGVSLPDVLDRANRVEAGAGGLLLLPYLGGERTPNLPDSTGSLFGLTANNARPDCFFRAAIDGVAAGIAYCVAALANLSVSAPRIVLVGGGSRHIAWQQAIADATGLPVTVRGGVEHVARGAAVQIAAIVRGQTVASLAGSWRPEILAEIPPRPDQRPAFQLERRRQLIDELRHNAK